MTDVKTRSTDKEASPPSMLLVVSASAAGTAFEWYDFFVFVPLASILAKTFAAGLNEAAGYVFALGAFAAGFAFRPLGALIFGRIGDRSGRKGAFLVTVTLMGAATFLIGCLPSFAQVGVISPILFISMRALQGVALGGEYGGAAIYVAEHARPDQRGFMTSFIQTSAAIGLTTALLVTLITRGVVGETAFAAWGWRVPFWASAGLLLISLFIRLKLSESPAFAALEAKGGRSEKPYVESFLRWANLKTVLIALFSMMIAQGAVWYCAFFYAQFFIERVIKTPPATVNLIMIAMVISSAPLYVFFGWLSDKVGRKIVMMLGTALATAALFPAFQMITAAANPALVAAQARAPVVVYADPSACSLQFDLIGKAQFRSSCDVAKSVLTTAGVSYRNAPAPVGEIARVQIADTVIPSADGRALTGAPLKALKASVEGRIKGALAQAGYPAQADPKRVDAVRIYLILMIFTIGATALYGPQAAALVELFPTRIRYTALSLPYHIGTGWVGGFLPATAYAMVVAKGDIYFGLWYPVIAGAISVLAFIFLLPETRGRDLNR
jgi:MFS family permease